MIGPSPGVTGCPGLMGAVTASTVISATSGLTLTASWIDSVTDYSTLGNSSAASAKLVASFGPSDTGILMESGGTGTGLALYLHDGDLVFQCGNGEGYDASQYRAVLTWPVPEAGTYTIEWSAQSGVGAMLYINGVSISPPVQVDHEKISGGDVGGLGRIHNVACLTAGGWTDNGDGVFSGTIHQCLIFEGQITDALSG